jgi:amine acid ABC transporter, permease protein, 3-TM region, His/Glu/Gln/Arg/opine family
MSTTAQELERPQQQSDVGAWLRQNLFNGVLNTLITIVLVIFIPIVLFLIVRWAIFEATWQPVATNFRLLMTGRYPIEHVWRIQACMAIIYLLFGLSAGIWQGMVRTIGIGLVGFAIFFALFPFSVSARLWLVGSVVAALVGYFVGRPFSSKLRIPVIVLWLISPFIFWLLIRGGMLGLPLVTTNLWGGLLLTIILAVVGIIASFPIGVLLALGRQSKLPIIKWCCTLYIELVRGVPLISVLFMAVLMLPLFLPSNIRIDNLVRVLVAITGFSAAYLAENVRGGLQSVPRGQYEAASALGLNVFQTTFLIVLPQALRAVIPALVGQFISLFKDTSLVSIVGLAELLGIAGIVINQPEWLQVTGGVEREVLLFAALVYWFFCYTLSKISRRIEAHLGVGTR